MRWWWQYRKEVASFFYSPVAPVVVGASLLLNGAMFLFLVMMLSGPQAVPGAPMELFFSWVLFWVVVLVLTPLLTMRAFAEEHHTGTFELLATAPIGDAAVVTAKYAAALTAYCTLWIPTAVFPLLLSRYAAIDWGPVASGYLGTFLVGVMLVAVGVLCSTWTRSQVVAALVSFGAIMAVFVAGLLRYLDWFSDWALFRYIDLMGAMESYAKGVVDTRLAVYAVSVAATCLFAATVSIKVRRWRG